MIRPKFRRTLPMLSSLAVAIAASVHAGGPSSSHSTMSPQLASALERMRSNAREQWESGAAKFVRRTPHATGSNLQVTSCADDGSDGTLRVVVASAQTGDTVDLTQLSCATITLTQGYILDNFEVPSFTIQGPGMHALTISGANASGIFYHAGSGQLSISDVSLADGYAEDSWGGCLLAPGGGFALSRVSVSNCEVHQVTMLHGSNAMGGGVMAFGEVDVVDSVITGNTLSSELADAAGYTDVLSGGGIFSLIGPLTVTRSAITNNTIVSTMPIQGELHGGGATSQVGAVTATDSVFSGNSMQSGFMDDAVLFSRSAGAGLEAQAGDLAIANSTFDGNSIVNALPVARSYGAGIFFGGNYATISGSTFSNNYSMGRSAGICDHGYSMALVNTTVSGNHAVDTIGGVYAVGTLHVTNSTIAFNISDAGVGGLGTYAATSLQSTIIASNTGTGGSPDIQLMGSGSVSGNHDFVGVPGSVSLPPDTISGDPLLQPLAVNGGPTRTHALGVGSTAIDAGSNPLALDFDQRGSGYPRVVGSAADIGAYESGTSPPDEIFANGFDP